MIYYALRNLTSTDVKEVKEPWNFKANVPEQLRTKEDFISWSKNPNTEHQFLSIYEGINAGIRINIKQGNPPFRMHGLIADYDAFASEGAAEVIKEILDDVPELLPNWIIHTRSNHRRLVWEFESPLGLNAECFTTEFVKLLTRELRLRKLLAGLDEGALNNPTTHYETGLKWERLSESPLPTDTLANWFAEAVEKSSKQAANKSDLPEIPMDRVYERILEVFPDRWPKELSFIEGCRGPAFWDPSANNPTACVFYKHGVYRYSSDKIFHSYSEIFGKDFVRQWETDRIGAGTAGIYYSGRSGYHRKFPNGKWVNQPKEDLQLYLVTTQGFSIKKPTHRDPSEVDRALLNIQHSRHVDGAMPFVYNAEEIVTINGCQFLNTSWVKVMEPAESPGHLVKWGEDFPWIAEWLIEFFDPKKQLVYFLTWLKLFWESARKRDLHPGHAVFMVGGTNLGKTLLNAKWIPMIMGGGVDAGNHLVKGEQFNKHLLEVAHWHIDDALGAVNDVDHRKFTERIKKLVANPTLSYRPMYVDEQKLPWRGRLLVTLNDDSHSLKLIPDLDRNIEDKLLVFQCAKRKAGFFDSRWHTEMTLAKETPFFLRWLSEWTPPKALTTRVNTRFGMRRYIHPLVKESSTYASSSGDLLGVFAMLWKNEDTFLEASKNPFSGGWEGTAVELTAIIAGHPVAKNLLDRMSARGLGMRLSKLAKITGSGVEELPRKTASHKEFQRYLLRPPEDISLNKLAA